MDHPYDERLLPPWWMWLLVVGFALSIGAAYGSPFGVRIGFGAGVIAGFAATTAVLVWSARVVVSDGELRAGPAHVPLRFVAATTPLTAADARLLRGRDGDPMAWMLLRGWVPTAVRVDLDDVDDPTPYWYVSTRHPQRLAQAVLDEQQRTTRSDA